MRRLLETILMLLGGLSLVFGALFFRDDPPPKPTQEDQVTRLDYLSGRYEEALRNREREIVNRKRRGSWLAGMGVFCLVAGLGCFFSESEPSGESIPQSDMAENGKPDPADRVHSS